MNAMAEKRQVSDKRSTLETRIRITLDLDGDGNAEVETGIPFFDHMLNLFARHGLFDLSLTAEGDVEVDYHHTVEDTGLVLGAAVKRALGDKRGIRRYGSFYVPMDESLARVVIDLSNRPHLVYRIDPKLETPMVRDFNIQLMREFFQAFANEAGANLHCRVEYGSEPHHVAEALIKAFARALDEATSIDPRWGGRLPTTKGSI